MESGEHGVLTYVLVEADFLIQESSLLDLATFQQNGTLRRAFVRSLTVLGEAAALAGPDMRTAHPDVAWDTVIEITSSLRADPFAIDYGLVWKFVHDEIPVLRQQVAHVMDARTSDEQGHA